MKRRLKRGCPSTPNPCHLPCQGRQLRVDRNLHPLRFFRRPCNNAKFGVLAFHKVSLSPNNENSNNLPKDLRKTNLFNSACEQRSGNLYHDFSVRKLFDNSTGGEGVFQSVETV